MSLLFESGELKELEEMVLVGKTKDGKTVTVAQAGPEFQAYALAILERQVNDLFFELPDVIPFKAHTN